MLEPRAQHLLKTLVERYIAEGEPVGSRTLSKYAGLDLSPASIRNVMADLEEMGFITSPHTSAGRVPTTRGYRLFVDILLTIKQLESVDLHQLEGHLVPDHPQRLITAASQLLAELTRFAGVVVVPKRRNPVFRHIEFLPLSDKRVLLIIVTPDGDVQNRILITERSYSQSELTTASNFLNTHYAGVRFEDVRSTVHAELQQLRSDVMHLMSTALEVSNRALAENNDAYVITGERNLLASNDLSSNMARLRELFDLFESKTALLQLLDSGAVAHGVQLFIGGESGIAPLDECSVVTAPYEANGQVVGTLGVIGPTRMAYERVIPIVDITARLLSGALTHGS